MGLQSLGCYAATAWLPSLLKDAGLSEADAGWMLSFSSLFGVLGSFVAPVIVGRRLRPGVLAALGAPHDVSGNWTVPLAVLLLLLVPQVVMGFGAGRDQHVAGAA
ncbi:hypothetical protein [Streptacidiphilus sp. P02-A3a]|uniref:hypothetical protein n=1 Tax=Streptacidiphilus sp. P02-A3a TaxID=2704468 RepID=UPI001CDCCF8F|nr:hypothetical protein [Streptacidiphilus sp. P02-A3a]